MFNSWSHTTYTNDSIISAQCNHVKKKKSYIWEGSIFIYVKIQVMYNSNTFNSSMNFCSEKLSSFLNIFSNANGFKSWLWNTARCRFSAHITVIYISVQNAISRSGLLLLWHLLLFVNIHNWISQDVSRCFMRCCGWFVSSTLTLFILSFF